jgi:hypothetical protein
MPGSWWLTECPSFLQIYCLHWILTCSWDQFLHCVRSCTSFSLRQMTETTVSGLQQISYAVDDLGMGAEFVVGVTDLCVLQTFQTVGSTRPPVQWVAGAIYLWVMQSRCVMCMYNTRTLSWHSASFRRGTTLSLPLLGVARIHYVYIGANILGF